MSGRPWWAVYDPDGYRIMRVQAATETEALNQAGIVYSGAVGYARPLHDVRRDD